MDDSGVLYCAYVLVRGGKIAYVGTEEPKEFHGEVIDGLGKVLIPGLINCHTHIPMTALRGYADGYDLDTWLNKYIFPAEDRLDDRCVQICSDIALAEMAACGTSSFSDMYMFCDVIAERAVAAGMKLNLGRGVSFFGESFDFDSYHSTAETKSLFKRWHGYDDGRVRLDACVHGEYTSSPEVWRGIAAFARENAVGVHLHLSETKKEHEDCKRRRGMTPAEAFLDAGLFDSPVTAAHCVWLEPGDIEILARSGATAVHCPVSNMKLGAGFAPVPELLSEGVNVALGTDGVSSNNSHDLFEEIKAAALIHKAARHDPSLISAETALKMATVAGAKAQGRENECGRIRVGLDADLALLDFAKPQLQPCHDPLSNLVYSARGSDVVLTMVRGRIIYKNGKLLTIDAEKAIAELDYVMKKVFG